MEEWRAVKAYQLMSGARSARLFHKSILQSLCRQGHGIRSNPFPEQGHGKKDDIKLERQNSSKGTHHEVESIATWNLKAALHGNDHYFL